MISPVVAVVTCDGSTEEWHSSRRHFFNAIWNQTLTLSREPRFEPHRQEALLLHKPSKAREGNARSGRLLEARGLLEAAVRRRGARGPQPTPRLEDGHLPGSVHGLLPPAHYEALGGCAGCGGSEVQHR